MVLPADHGSIGSKHGAGDGMAWLVMPPSGDEQHHLTSDLGPCPCWLELMVDACAVDDENHPLRGTAQSDS